MGEISVGDEPVELVGEHQSNEEWKAYVAGADILVDHSRTQVRQQGDVIKAGDRVRFGDLRGLPVYAVARTPGEEASVRISRDALSISFMTRHTVGAVQRNDGSEASPASDAYEAFYGESADVNAAPVAEAFEAPDRADFLVVSVDDAAGPYHVEVRYCDDQYNTITQRDDTTDASLSGDASDDVLTRVAVASPYVEVRIVDDSGASNPVDYNIYAR